MADDFGNVERVMLKRIRDLETRIEEQSTRDEQTNAPVPEQSQLPMLAAVIAAAL